MPQSCSKYIEHKKSKNKKMTYVKKDHTVKNIPNEINDFKESNFRELFSKAIIVNKKLVYFIIGNPEMDKYPIKPNLRFKGNIRYTIRITEFNTNFGIIINR